VSALSVCPFLAPGEAAPDNPVLTKLPFAFGEGMENTAVV